MRMRNVADIIWMTHELIIWAEGKQFMFFTVVLSSVPESQNEMQWDRYTLYSSNLSLKRAY
jgi:hypothetical protein